MILAEVPESEATGTIAETYAEIRATLGVPVVNLVYRHLAAQPGRLEATWAALRPNLLDPATDAIAARLVEHVEQVRPRVGERDPDAIDRNGVSDAVLGRARATLAVYERANALNLLAGRALLRGTPGSARTSDPRPRKDSGEILPMATLDALDDRTRTRLEAIAAATVRPDEAFLIPSLYRHLASDPGLLALITEVLGPILDTPEPGRCADAVRERAAELALSLPRRVDPTESADARQILERFTTAMATMLVVGGIICEALGR